MKEWCESPDQTLELGPRGGPVVLALAVEAGILGWEMFKNGGKQFYSGEGIITKGVENTIRNVGILGHDGMKATDRTIMDIMLRRNC